MEGKGPYKSGQSASKQDGTGYKPKASTQVSQLRRAYTSNNLTSNY